MLYDTVFLLAADIRKDGEIFRLAEEDAGGLLLGEWRLRACKEALEQGLANHVVVVGWHDEEYPGISRAEIIRDLLVEEGVSPSVLEAVTQEEDGTYGNVSAVSAYLSAHDLAASECAFLTNYYHIPRAAFLFAQRGIAIVPLAAESFLPKEREAIVAIYGSNGFRARLGSELDGMRANWRT